MSSKDRDTEVGMIGELVELQRKMNRQWEAMTPNERAATARQSLRRMAESEPGLRYLFDEPEGGWPE